MFLADDSLLERSEGAEYLLTYLLTHLVTYFLTYAQEYVTYGRLASLSGAGGGEVTSLLSYLLTSLLPYVLTYP